MNTIKRGDFVLHKLSIHSKKEETWVKARVTSYNARKNTYSLSYLQSELQALPINPTALQVPAALIRFNPAPKQSKMEVDISRLDYGGMEAPCDDEIDEPIDEESTSPLNSRSDSGSESPHKMKENDEALSENKDDISEASFEPKAGEFDYSVQFEKAPLGFNFCPFKNEINACVGKRFNEYSKKHVHKGSLILAVNDRWLLGESTEYIQNTILSESKQSPIVMTFRAKEGMKSGTNDPDADSVWTNKLSDDDSIGGDCLLSPSHSATSNRNFSKL